VRRRTAPVRQDRFETGTGSGGFVMSGIGDSMAMQDQDRIDEAAAAAHARQYNSDGTLKADNYRPPGNPQSKFPPGISFGGQLRVNREGLTAVAAQMQSDLNELQANLQSYYGGGAGGATLYGWETAAALGGNASNAFTAIAGFYQELNAVYDQMIAYLHQTAQNYADAEETTAAAARNVGSGA
jgi:uncharacterized protein YukE